MRIFIIEDDPIYAEFVSASLGKTAGRTITCFTTAEEALEATAEGSPDIMIADFRLPGMSGIDLFEKIQPNHKETRFIMMSALDDGLQVLGFIQKGLRDYVMKDDRIIESLNAIINGQDDTLIY